MNGKINTLVIVLTVLVIIASSIAGYIYAENLSLETQVKTLTYDKNYLRDQVQSLSNTIEDLQNKIQNLTAENLKLQL